MKTKSWNYSSCLMGLVLLLFSIYTFGQESNEIVTDIDGNVYHTVVIGTQTWMVENLRTTRYTNGEAISNVSRAGQWCETIGGAYCWYNNDIFFKNVYGALYNGWTVIISNSIKSNSLAPKGWHVPSKEEWQKLIDYLGGEKIAGGKMKETGTEHWSPWNVGATNESGFAALPSGSTECNENLLSKKYHKTYFSGLNLIGSYWSSSNNETNSDDLYSIEILCNQADIEIKTSDISTGMSIRCIKD